MLRPPVHKCSINKINEDGVFVERHRSRKMKHQVDITVCLIGGISNANRMLNDHAKNHPCFCSSTGTLFGRRLQDASCGISRRYYKARANKIYHRYIVFIIDAHRESCGITGCKSKRWIDGLMWERVSIMRLRTVVYTYILNCACNNGEHIARYFLYSITIFK